LKLFSFIPSTPHLIPLVLEGAIVGVTQRVLNTKTLTAKHITVACNLPKVSHLGTLNPYYGMTHSLIVREAISIVNGTSVSHILNVSW
jgi:hypothetical protein